MCGVAGLLIDARMAAREHDLAGAAGLMSGTIRHRGPDDSGVHVSADGLCALASQRLAIQDLSPCGHMPFCNEDGSVWTAFNGEIYNFKALRSELRAAGHTFKSGSDTEVIVHGYESWGAGVLDRLDGMFAIALYDEHRQELLLARDRLGEKPLYLAAIANGQIAFASEIKAILQLPNVRRRADPDALWDYLTYGYVMPPRTLFSGIQKLAPGEMIRIDRHLHVERRTFFTPSSDSHVAAAIRVRSETEHVETIRAMLRASVEARMIADVPVGAFLSGGVDSSAVVALMSQISGRRIETVTVANEGFQDLDEWTHAERIARDVGARSHRVVVSERDAISALPEVVWHLDEPVADPAALNTYFASRALRAEGVVVSLVGEGADEVFLGYGNYLKYQRLARAMRLRAGLPEFLARAGAVAGRALLAAVGVPEHGETLSRGLRGEPLFLGTELFFGDAEKRTIAGPGLSSGGPSIRAAQLVHADAPRHIAEEPLSLFSFAEVRMRLAEKLLMRVDKMASAHSLEIRSPFLDHRLVDYALSIPASARTSGGVTKHLLKRAVEPLIPHDVIHRPKQGFSTPMATWLKGDLGRHFEDGLANSAIVKHGLLDAAAVRNLLARHRSGARSNRALHTRLWNLLILMKWYDRFAIEGIAERDFAPAIAK